MSSLSRLPLFYSGEYFLSRFLHVLSACRDSGKILNLIQYSWAILLLCKTSLHLPFRIPFLPLSQTGLSILMLLLYKKQKHEDEQALWEEGRPW